MIYAIGDIHGCHDQLIALLAKIKAHAGRNAFLAIFLGDYVDRGPKSRETVNQVRGLVTGRGGHGKWIALKGNHEDMMVAGAANTLRDFWEVNGGKATLASYANREAELQEHAKWLSTLPTSYETENYYFVHAGCSPRYALSEQPDDVKLWIRNWENAEHDFGKHIVYGHTPGDRPELLTFSSCLDTGACFGGPLTCGVFDETRAAGPVELLQVP